MRQLVIPTLVLAGCGVIPNMTVGNGQIVSAERTGDAVPAVSVQNALRTEVTLGDGPSLTIRSDKNIVDLIETVVENDTLVIRVKHGHSIEPTELDIQLHLPSLERIEGSGATKLKLHAQQAATLSVTLSGASMLSADGLALDSLSADLSGASGATLSGHSTTLDLHASGASELTADALQLVSAMVDLSGASHATLLVSSAVTGSASGASHLSLVGMPSTPPHVDLSGASTLTY